MSDISHVVVDFEVQSEIVFCLDDIGGPKVQVVG